MARAYHQGRLIFFLGAGFNLADRPKCSLSECQEAKPPREWCAGVACPVRSFLPSGAELGKHLAAKIPQQNVTDLLKVSQMLQAKDNVAKLNQHLDQIFTNHHVTPSQIHHFLRSLCEIPAAEPSEPEPYPLIVTTNYDDLVEHRMDCDLLFYVPKEGGCFYRISPGSQRVKIQPGTAHLDTYPYFRDRPTVLKIHGHAPKRGQTLPFHPNMREEAYVITEDNYLDYLSGNPIEQMIPASIRLRLQNQEILFLGYSLGDWNVRAFLFRFRQANSSNGLLGSYQGQPRYWAVSRSWENAPHYTGVTLVTMELADFRSRFRNSVAKIDAKLAEKILV